VSKNIFDVNIIPHTLKGTNFDKIKIGELLNIEVDMIARYTLNYLKMTK
jgi:riboflavin synthase